LLANVPYARASIRESYKRHVVDYHRREAPGTIVVDTDNRYLYYVLPKGQALRYGVTVGEEALDAQVVHLVVGVERGRAATGAAGLALERLLLVLLVRRLRVGDVGLQRGAARVERELARIFDFYRVPWRYEPDSKQRAKPQTASTSAESVALSKDLKKRGFTSPYLRPFVVARVNPIRFSKSTEFDFDEVLDRMEKSAAKFNVDRVKQEDVVRAGGGPVDEGD